MTRLNRHGIIDCRDQSGGAMYTRHCLLVPFNAAVSTLGARLALYIIDLAPAVNFTWHCDQLCQRKTKARRWDAWRLNRSRQLPGAVNRAILE